MVGVIGVGVLFRSFLGGGEGLEGFAALEESSVRLLMEANFVFPLAE